MHPWILFPLSRRVLLVGGLSLFGLMGCSGEDGPVRPAGSIDIPEAALRSRPGANLQTKVQNKAQVKQATPAAPAR